MRSSLHLKTRVGVTILQDSISSPVLAVIGGGPAGLMAAEAISAAGYGVDIYDAMPSVGRKFLMAGKGGLNLTHSEPLERFVARYATRQEQLEPIIQAFTPQDLRAWVKEIGVDTFVGTSGRVFPTDFKAAPLLREWLHRLRETDVRFHMRHRWLGWTDEGALMFRTPQGDKTLSADAVVLALGGGSWARLGSDGAWVLMLRQRGVRVESLKPANCGFDVSWSDHFRATFAGHPVKSVVASFTNSKGDSFHQRGEFVITETGVEGGLIYALSAALREEIEDRGFATLELDLFPNREKQRLIQDLSRSRGSESTANFLRKRTGIEGVKAGLLREVVRNFSDAASLADTIKALPIHLSAARPIDEAISTAGGVAFEELDEHLMLRRLPGVFCAGEMLDWEAPTGGYLLTACFATGKVAGEGLVRWIKSG